jgi:thiol-disulfide isomerase/thioredoxin
MALACALATALSAACDGDPGPMRTRRERAAATPAPAANGVPLQPFAPATALPEGLLTTDAASLLQHAKRPGSRGLLVNVWATWCGSCREEIPMLLQLQRAFAAENVELSFVSADQPDDFARAVTLLHDLGGALPVLAVQPGTMGTFKRALSPRWRGGIPATFLFDPTGKLRHLWEGPILEHEITPIVQSYLAGEPITEETRTAAEPQ